MVSSSLIPVMQGQVLKHNGQKKENTKKQQIIKSTKPTSVAYPSEQILIKIKNTEVFHLFELYNLCAVLLVCSQFVLPYAMKDHEHVKRVYLSCFETNEKKLKY